jgi:thymidylate kinase
MLRHEVMAFYGVAARLECSGKPYCVLHGWEDLGQRTTTDIDLAISPKALPVLEAALESDGWSIVQLLNYEIGSYYFVASRENNKRREFLCIDAITDFRHKGRIYITNQQLLTGARRYQKLIVAAPEAEFTYLLVKKILKGTFPKRQRARLVCLCGMLGQCAGELTARLLGRTWGWRALAWITAGEWGRLGSNALSLRRALHRVNWRRDPRRVVCSRAGEARRLLQRVLYPTGLMIALLGPDGSGKTTLIKNLQGNLTQVFRGGTVFNMRPDILGRNKPGPNLHPHAIRALGMWLSLSKVIFLLVDFVVGYVALVRYRLVRNELVLFDRYYHDLLIDPVRYRFGGSFWAARVTQAVIPRPELFLILDAPDELVLQRKAELPIETLKSLRASYRAFAATLRNAFMIDASLETCKVALTAERIVCDYLHARYLARRHLWFAFGKEQIKPAGDL